MTDKHDIKILYLEDDPDSIELVTFTLGLDGIQARVVSTAEEALEAALLERFDLFMLDGLVETGYSFELCRKLKELCPDVPVAFYTALGFPQDIQKGLDAGASAYLVKPFVGDLAVTIRQTIESSRQRRGHYPAPCGGTPQKSAARL